MLVVRYLQRMGVGIHIDGVLAPKVGYNLISFLYFHVIVWNLSVLNCHIRI